MYAELYLNVLPKDRLCVSKSWQQLGCLSTDNTQTPHVSFDTNSWKETFQTVTLTLAWQGYAGSAFRPVPFTHCQSDSVSCLAAQALVHTSCLWTRWTQTGTCQTGSFRSGHRPWWRSAATGRKLILTTVLKTSSFRICPKWQSTSMLITIWKTGVVEPVDQVQLLDVQDDAVETSQKV